MSRLSSPSSACEPACTVMCLKELNIDQQPAWADLLDRKGPGTDPETNPIQIRFATTMTFWSTKGANYGSRQLKMDYLAFCLSTSSATVGSKHLKATCSISAVGRTGRSEVCLFSTGV